MKKKAVPPFGLNKINISERENFRKSSNKKEGGKTSQPLGQGYFLIFQFINNPKYKTLNFFTNFHILYFL